jgi:hypothetical protein
LQLGFVDVYISTTVENNIIVVDKVNGVDYKLACDLSKNPTINNM